MFLELATFFDRFIYVAADLKKPPSTRAISAPLRPQSVVPVSAVAGEWVGVFLLPQVIPWVRVVAVGSVSGVSVGLVVAVAGIFVAVASTTASEVGSVVGVGSSWLHAARNKPRTVGKYQARLFGVSNKSALLWFA